MNKGFLLQFALGFFSMALVLLVANLTLIFVGEIKVGYVVDRQLARDKSEEVPIIFNSGLNQDVMPYKLNLLQKVDPEVIVLGSSRSMQVRKEFFNVDFVNMGGAFRSVADFEMFAEWLATEPKHVSATLIFLDPWWFHPTRESPMYDTRLTGPSFATLDMLLSALRLLAEGNWITGPLESSRLGIYAILRHDGYGPDGSYHYVRHVQGMPNNPDFRFTDTSHRIANGIFPFLQEERFSYESVNRMCAAVVNMASYSDQVLLVRPPYASSIKEQLKSSKRYSYIDAAFRQLQQCTGKVIYDFTERPAFDDCEFIDGYHGGDTVYARLVESIADGNQMWSDLLNLSFLRDFISAEAGFATGLTRRLFNGQARDFLGLGCIKAEQALH